MRVLDLFSGIGGFSLGLERTGGFKTVQFCEIDPFCRRVLAKHWPDVPCHDDVTTMQFHEGMADVITGGFPCQDVSLAGKRAGITGERSGLYRYVVEAIRVVRPRYAILENVAALHGDGLDVVLGDLATIRYDAEVHCIPLGNLGAPHERDRTWIVAHAEKIAGVHKPYAWQRTRRLSDHSTYWQANPWDEANPRICRVDDGIPDRVDRTGALGNSIGPAIAEAFGQAILTAEQQQARAA